MSAPPNHVFTIFAFVAFFLCIIKFPMQLNAWNVGIHLYLAWVGLQCLILGINSIIWNHNTVNWAPVWCDIASRISIGITIAVPAIVLLISRRLYLLASPTSLLPSKANKYREIMIDLIIGMGLPIIIMVLSFFCQSARFVIFEDFGCTAAIASNWISILLLTALPLVLELIAAVYDCLCLHAFYTRRSQMKALLSSHPGINPNRYIRLMYFSICDLVTGIPVTVFYLYISISSGINPFTGLKAEHYHFSETTPVPAVLWRSGTINEAGWELNRWIVVFAAFVFFAIFGFTEGTRKKYLAAFQAVIQVFTKITGIKWRTVSNTQELNFKSSTGDLPVESVA